MPSPVRRAFTARGSVHALWYAAFVLALLVLVISLPGYVQRVFDLNREPIDAPERFVLTVRALGMFASLGTAGLSLALAALLFARKRDERMAVFVSFYLIGYGITISGPIEALVWLDPRWTDWGLRVMTAVLLTPTMLLFAWFPNGQFVPRGMRYAVLATLPFVPLTLIFSPSAWFASGAWLIALANVLMIGLFVIGIGAQIYRYRRVSTPTERQQTKWFVFGLLVWATLFMLVTIPYIILQNYPPNVSRPWWAPLSELVWWLTLMVIPLSLTIAIMRYRLWEIDVILNRALVYGALTALVIGMYVAIVGGLSIALQTQTNWLTLLLATGVVAILFAPLRDRVQRAVNRFSYGERDEPYTVITKLGQRLESTLNPDAVLPAIVETVAQALKLPYAAITLEDEASIIAAHGNPALVTRHSSLVTLPLVYQNESVGALLLAPRAGEEKFSDADQRLLDDFARQAGVAVHAARLAADLQRSREKIVTAREEERRRIRRDLHDGLGPALASITLKLDAARNLLQRDPATTDQLLIELKAQTQAAIGDIRRLVYDLRPPALDELGLVGALREQMSKYEAAGLRVNLCLPATLPALPAAVEVAAYRIATAALTNVLHHAQARSCTVCVALDGALTVEISDDGVGLPTDLRAGVGLHSMRERAAELGGMCLIETREGGGTRVVARLPLGSGG